MRYFLRRWNWKSAVLSSLVRSALFFVANIGAELGAQHVRAQPLALAAVADDRETHVEPFGIELRLDFLQQAHVLLRRDGVDTSNRLILQSFDEAAKQILDARPDAVKWAHDAGLTVPPYTFRAGATARFASVREEMRHFLYQLGVDGVFTDNPDQFPAK